MAHNLQEECAMQGQICLLMVQKKLSKITSQDYAGFSGTVHEEWTVNHFAFKCTESAHCRRKSGQSETEVSNCGRNPQTSTALLSERKTQEDKNRDIKIGCRRIRAIGDVLQSG